MYLQRTQRKIMLLYARLMELCATGESVNGGKVIKSSDSESFCLETKDEIKVLLSVKDIRQWRTQRHAQPHQLSKLDRLVTALFPSNSPQKRVVSDSQREVDVFEFAARLGISAPRARYIIDYEYASKLPTYSAVTQKRGAADKFALRHGGLYSLYRHDHNQATRREGMSCGIITRSTLSIRYPVPYKAHESNGRGASRVRCKLNVPGYGNQGPAVYKYDGYVASNRCWSQFLLQGRPSAGRSPDSEDLILMYTEPFPQKKALSAPLRGVVLTQNQGDRLNPTVSTVVLVREVGYGVRRQDVPRSVAPRRKEKLPEYFSSYYSLMDESGAEVDEQKFMHGRPGILSLAAAREWSDVDAIAVQILFDGWSDLNIQGLHI